MATAATYAFPFFAQTSSKVPEAIDFKEKFSASEGESAINALIDKLSALRLDAISVLSAVKHPEAHRSAKTGGPLLSEVPTFVESCIEDPKCIETARQKISNYLAALRGLVDIEDEEKPINGKSPWRTAPISWTWSNVSEGSTTKVNDAAYEFGSVLVAFGLWQLSLGHQLHERSVKDNSDTLAKLAYTTLLMGSGVLDSFLTVRQSGILDGMEGAPDLREKTARAWSLMCLAHAQEITIARGIEKKTSALLIAKLCTDTSGKFHEAYTQLSSLVSPNGPASPLEKLLAYLKFKKALYDALAWMHYAMDFKENEKHGEAVVAAQHSSKLAKAAEKECNAYIKTEPKTSGAAKEALMACMGRALAAVDETANRFLRENDMVYFSKVPPVLPDPIPRESLVKPTVYSLPTLDPAWADIPPPSSSQHASLPPPPPPPSLPATEGEKKKEVVEKEEEEDKKTEGTASATAATAGAETAASSAKDEDQKKKTKKKKSERSRCVLL